MQTLSARPSTGLSFRKQSHVFGARPAALSRPAPAPRRSHIVSRAERDGAGGFWSGVFVGGAVFGALGYVFAPQISKALLGEDQKLRLPRFLEEQDVDPETSKQNLADQIAQLNSTIDTIQQSLNTTTLEKEEIPA
ncbi:hypothetical protein ACKKBG_A29635 [Auxenochlorella protothecoides x Auxenochlorella symbiontica]|uniref:Uncharacterized protein n=1 Tax=Auxenochlorella protothecoides TaxID=3075 RepID=A0A087SE93_AUXPR|nr:hypothetical protein F751_0231 [Auxenochlorella protothecoides]KFM24047.1 hypothetical protein F751_0231 [Auxenochlorella protothecoides]RMZ53777.1 hypothetical protein APUTEX25_003916 [Auxenochlorella protothecoides]|eukprot:RMZ53777.1 hypothetical protein APUTEX25_003916 [Auxenochlorella protothecoides]